MVLSNFFWGFVRALIHLSRLGIAADQIATPMGLPRSFPNSSCARIPQTLPRRETRCKRLAVILV